MENFLLDECLLNKFDLIALVCEEGASKQSIGIKREFGVKKGQDPVDLRTTRSSESQRIEEVRQKIESLTKNLNECQSKVMANDSGSNSGLL